MHDSSPSDKTASVGGLVGFAGVVAYVGRFVVFGFVVVRREVVVRRVVVVVLGFFVVGATSSYSSSATI